MANTVENKNVQVKDGKKTDVRVTAFRDSFLAALEYARPRFEMYARLYELWKGKPFSELEGTFSKINLMLAHATIQDRLPKIAKPFQHKYVSVDGANPVSTFTAPAAQTWLRSILRDQIKLEQSIMPTLQTALIGGTAYRMPHVCYVQEGGEWEKYITSRDVDFFHVLPAPLGGQVNPVGKYSENAVPWVMIVDWWTNEYIEAMAEQGVLEKEGVDRLMNRGPQDVWLEDMYRGSFQVIGKLQYQSEASWRQRLRGVDAGANSSGAGHHRRRIVHWIRRDRHIIIGEDFCVLYDGKNETGTIPLAKYSICPDQNNWFGIPYLFIMEDVLKAQVMNLNLRFDNLIRQMYPRTLVPKEWAEAMKLTDRDFIPRPYRTLYYPQSLLRNGLTPESLIVTNREDGAPPEAFMEEDRLKAHLQKIGGQTETTNSLGDVIGNKTATGVTSIMAELAGRPDMEAMLIEQGFRDECILLLALAKRHLTEPQTVRVDDAEDGFGWTTVDPDEIAGEYDVTTHGTKFISENQQKFQKLLAMYPMWNQSQNIDQYELASQSLEVADALPRPEKLLLAPETTALYGNGSASAQAPGGAASALDINQQINSVANRTKPEPKTGRAVPAEA